MLFVRIILMYVLIVIASSQVTIVKRNALLSRKKRFLAFPMNSNFVINFSFVKALMEVVPKGFNLLGECDVPFPLPSDTRWFKKNQRSHYLRRREILAGFETAFFQNGLNGTACVKRMICEAQQYIDMEGKSLVKDFLSAIFMSTEIDLDVRYVDSCHAATFSECVIPFLGYTLGSLLPT